MRPASPTDDTIFDRSHHVTIPLLRPLFIVAMLAEIGAAILASGSLASADAPSHWNNEGCHALDEGRTLCYEDSGLYSDRVNESGRWAYAYRGHTRWTVYDATGAVEYTETTRVHVTQHGDGSDTQSEHESFHYRYKGDDYSCKVSSQFHFVDGEVRVDHESGGCGEV
jgi:hypothetical protein